MSLLHEIAAVMRLAQYPYVCPFEQTESEYFFHWQIMRELCEEIQELAVRE
ncbi:hypothetical protein [Prevotella sp.]|uniref:hypothetical protein n=1 Tax=Prevotella sp. TaxID=59823 RepID=UPI0035B00FB2